ncbi:related to CBS and PB1 domain protein [Ustilago bromivora]|uniref:Related to CBS and PB1 domain protein n=1 Tax=Ustilago bromivora TaxID=307758 RepID=A0A1K0G176_9BASI|nr:related to CBS and PB1 domain protein [Ustilago bromivora]SYW79103.1 related to CBS and PB1 domain protein [Ustilago bromivora]
MSRIPLPVREERSPSPLQSSTNLPRSTSMSQMSSTSSFRDATDTRKRQSKRDEAIRKKIEGELQRKSGKPSTPISSRRTNKRTTRPPAAAAGTVSALRPLPALTVPQSISVADASQLCAAKRTDCVLVVDEDEHLAGIFTAKDLAFRVVSAGLDARNTPVSAIMTRSPMVTRDTTSATEALNTMVTRGFRHLPVCNEDGDVVGLLDIAKVFYEALEKLERAHGSSQKLYNALEGVQSEWGGSAGPQQAMLQYIEALRQKMSIPDLSSILDSRTLPCCVGVRTTVREAARLMKEHHTTAVCVMESTGTGPGTGQIGGGGAVSGKIAGIFTSKDVVLRVIAAGLDPKTCSVVRVMTPHPDTALPSLTIQEALRKMHDGRYLNLPVVDVDSRLVGIVDVLKLTYATLEQINSMNDEQGGADGGAAGGPMWNRFWNSFGQSNSIADDDESAVSGSMRHSESQFEAPPTPSKVGAGTADISSDLHPNDSASAVGQPVNGDDGASAIGLPSSAAAVEADDGTYLFKFVTPSGRTHRFQARYDSYETIREIVCIKLGGDPFFEPAPASCTVAAPAATKKGEANGDAYPHQAPPNAAAENPDPNDFQLAYTDDEDDVVLITADGDVQDAVKVARKQGRDRVVLLLQGGRGWEEASAARASSSAAAQSNSAQAGSAAARKRREAVEAQLQSVAEEEDQEPTKADNEKKSTPATKRKPKAGEEELLFGVLPKDLALPAAIGFLGVAVLAAVAITKSGGGNAR